MSLIGRQGDNQPTLLVYILMYLCHKVTYIVNLQVLKEATNAAQVLRLQQSPARYDSSSR